jgi:hypothetical protein
MPSGRIVSQAEMATFRFLADQEEVVVLVDHSDNDGYSSNPLSPDYMPTRGYRVLEHMLPENNNVHELFEGMYQDKAFDRLPILADALEEVGVTGNLLDFCRYGTIITGALTGWQLYQQLFIHRKKRLIIWEEANLNKCKNINYMLRKFTCGGITPTNVMEWDTCATYFASNLVNPVPPPGSKKKFPSRFLSESKILAVHYDAANPGRIYNNRITGWLRSIVPIECLQA